ncbi:DUF6802 family protein [Prescottella sp. R16]|uniref:DUF6802 family protein n=1 Tax=Prescottella sp. R16 TaxID=3064529 RepID=UPI00272E04F9|nr:DUF6802 family protein [Prescottella sp. R16]
MITTDELAGGLPHLDPDTFGVDADAVHLTELQHDIDGDGILDTVTFETDDTVIVSTDIDGDGDADHVTIVGGDTGYTAWEFHRDADGGHRWERVDDGRLDA